MEPIPVGTRRRRDDVNAARPAALARRAEVSDFQEGSSQRGADGRIGFARATRNKLALDHIALSPVS